jgi:hypothetical protein
MIESIVIDGRFNGPPNSGNGGYVCDLLARSIKGSAEVTLRKPPPLSRPLAVERTPDAQVLLKDGLNSFGPPSTAPAILPLLAQNSAWPS